MVGQTLQGHPEAHEAQPVTLGENEARSSPLVRRDVRADWFEMSRGDDSDDGAVEVQMVSKSVSKQIGKFAERYGLDEKVQKKLEASSDEAVSRIVSEDLPSRVRNPSGYVTRMLQMAERDMASEADAGHEVEEAAAEHQNDETWHEGDNQDEGYADGVDWYEAWYDENHANDHDYREEGGWAEQDDDWPADS